MAKDTHLEETANPLAFLDRLDRDPELARRCRGTDLSGRMRIAAAMGLPFEEAHFRRTVRSWDLYGRWTGWLQPGPIDDPLDQLPDFSDDYVLPADAPDRYARDGYQVLRGVVKADEIDVYRPRFRQAVECFNTQTASATDSAEQRAFLQIINARQRDAALRRFVLGHRFARIAAELMGVSGVHVYLDQILYKEPSSIISHWHQDHTYFPLQTHHITTLWIPLVDVTPDMGTLVYAPGSHREGRLQKPDFDDAKTHLPEFVEALGYRSHDTGPMSAGDGVLHDGSVLHGALPNRSDRTREALSIAYYPEGTRIAEPTNEFQRRAIRYVYPGREPGDLAVGPLTPLAYSENRAEIHPAAARIS